MQFERYAIYWTPRHGSALARFGQTWLGSDLETGKDLETGASGRERETYGLDAALAERAVASPRRYGLHATLKAPMRLKEGRKAEALATALEAFAARRRRFLAGPPRLTRFGRYLALIPQAPTADLDWLAQECETAFDSFRAPLDESELTRRTRASMSAQQRELVASFGYPFVLSHFVFHITLAGPLADAELAQVEEALEPAVAQFCAEPLAIEEIVLSGDPGEGGRFRMIGRFPLGG
jgi:hypothetical protein